MKLSFSLSFLVILLSVQLTHAQTKKLMYEDNPLYISEKTPTDFPTQFLDAYICEDNLPSNNPKARCIFLGKNGEGTFQNDRFNDRDLPATPIKWYVVCNAQGQTFKSSNEMMDHYIIIIEFTQKYYSKQPGDLMSLPANIIRSTPGGSFVRVTLLSKYKDF